MKALDPRVPCAFGNVVTLSWAAGTLRFGKGGCVMCIHYICVYSLCMCVFTIYVSGKTRVDLRRSSGFCSGGTSKSLLFVDEVLYPQ